MPSLPVTDWPRPTDAGHSNSQYAFTPAALFQPLAYKTKAHCFVRSPKKATHPRLQTINDGALLDTGLLNEARQYFESQLLDLKEQLKNECKIRLAEKVTAVKSNQSSLFDRLVELERENHKLKSIVGDFRKSMGLLQARSLIDNSTATVRAAANPPTSSVPDISLPASCV